MVYNVDTEKLLQYLKNRLTHRNYTTLLGVEFTEKIQALELRSLMHNKPSMILKPRFVKGGNGFLDRIEIEIESDRDGEHFTRFLDELIDNDKIFEKGQPLYSQRREINLPTWQRTLKRIEDRDKMICEVREDVSTLKLENTVYEYMARACLYFLMVELDKV